MVAVHARPQAEESAAPNQCANAGLMGRRRSDRIARLRARLQCCGAGFAVRADRESRPPASRRAAPRFCFKSPELSRTRPDYWPAVGSTRMRVYQFTEQPYPDAWEN